MRYLLIDGHPDSDRLTTALIDHYAANCPAGADIDRLILRDMAFDPVLHQGYARPQKWEADLERAARLLDGCDHLVIAFPMWWGGEPALVKGFVDRLLLPHFTFRYHEHDDWWDKLMEGRSADALVTMDTPGIFLRFAYHNSIKHRWRKQILQFCGFDPARFHIFAPVRKGSAEKNWPKWQARVARAANSAVGLKRKPRQSHLANFLAYGKSRDESP
ncbi:NAD(P)H-dependent oxidoreductase [Parasphingorhabdus sp.]|uniref:NAD(P)H-dependent oxidoreductase n=1 Tax=Parasphingorhabdus sp. TaxID=2709688 RepID=UPI003594476C